MKTKKRSLVFEGTSTRREVLINDECLVIETSVKGVDYRELKTNIAVNINC